MDGSSSSVLEGGRGQKEVPPSRRSERSLNSSDDFEDSVPKRRTKMAAATARKRPPAAPTKVKAVEPEPNGTAEGDAVRPCPLCAKSFPAGHQARRGNHLRQCGRAKGMNTEQLLKIIRLEEKQARERKELGLPEHPVVAEENKLARTKKARQTKAKAGSSKKPAEADVDPHLELALAISASLAQSELRPPGGELATKSVEAEAATVVERPPASDPIKRSPKRLGGGPTTKKWATKTTLETRSEEERQRLISEEVAKVLSAPDSRIRAPRNCDSGAQSKTVLWRMAAVKSGDFYNGVVSAYSKAVRTSPKKTPQASKGLPKSGGGCGADSQQLLCEEWRRLFVSGAHSDVLVYTRDQGRLPCHSLVLLVRCPALMDEAVEEDSNDSGGSGTIVDLSCATREAARIFLGYLYAGALLDEVRKKSDFDILWKLAKKYALSPLRGLLDQVDETLLVPEEEEEEWDELNRELESRNEGGKVSPGTSSANAKVFPASPGKASPIRTAEESPERHSSIFPASPASTKGFPASPGRVPPTTRTVEESLERHPSILDQLDETFSQAMGCAMSSLKESPPKAQCPDSDEDLFGDDYDTAEPYAPLEEKPPVKSQANVESPKRSPLSFSQASSPEKAASEHASPAREGPWTDDVWDDFDCDAGTNIDDDSQQGELLLEVHQNGVEKVEEQKEVPAEPKKCSTPAVATLARKRVEMTPNYERMLTPELRRELKRFGLKAIPRRKAAPLLSHIHRETRKRKRLVMEEEDGGESSQTQSSQQSTCSEKEDGDDSFNLAEESIYGVNLEEEEEDATPLSTQQAKARRAGAEELPKLLSEFLRGNDALSAQVLLYEPFWLEDVFADFKARMNVRCKLADFMDALDAECVTFRTRASAGRRRRGKAKTRAPAKKKRAGARGSTQT